MSNRVPKRRMHSLQLTESCGSLGTHDAARRIERESRHMSTAKQTSANRRILVVLSEWGYWGEELLGPVETFDAAGYRLDFATPTGQRPRALPPSTDPAYVDPPLGRAVTTAEVANKVRVLDASDRLA